MTRPLCFVALLLGASSARPSAPPVQNTGVPDAGRAVACGYLADVEVSLGGVKRHGRILVTGDGRIHLEHLDEKASRWVNGVIRPEPTPTKGWDDRARRAGPVLRIWGRLGQTDVLTEIHTPEASLKVSRHKLLATR